MSGATAVRVLVADDDRLLRDIACATLEAAGFAVEAVASGDAAVAAYVRQRPDLVLLDVEMPDGDGYQACTNIRALPGGFDVPIVMVTGLDDPMSINLAYDAGATDFVVKPINWPLLVHRIRYVLRGARTIEALRLSEQKNSALLRAIPDGLFLVDAAGCISHCFSPLAGLPALAAPAGGPHLNQLLPPGTLARAMQCLDATLRGTPAAFEFAHGAGEAQRHFECRYLPNAGGQVLAIVRDISQRKHTEAHIHRLAYFDALTGLPNREWIGEYLSASLREALERQRPVALLFVDLDQFKRINDTLGHETGDALLSQVAERLSGALAYTGAGGQLARVGGDEFIVVLTGQPTAGDAEQAAQRIQNSLAAPFIQGGYEFVVTPSIGIALFPEHGADAQALMKNADLAMYEAKAAGRNQFRLYTSAVNARARQATVARDGAAARVREPAARGALPAQVRRPQPAGGGRGSPAALVPPTARPDPDRRLRGGGGGDRSHRRYRPLDPDAGVRAPAAVARRRAWRCRRSPSTSRGAISCARACCCACHRSSRSHTCRPRCSSSS